MTGKVKLTGKVKPAVKAHPAVKASHTSSGQQRPGREEQARRTYGRLMDAASKVVGVEGYAGASIAKIVAEAGLATGTFYNYFSDRQALFDALLPYIGHEMVDYISHDLRKLGEDVATGPEREVARFRAFCDYIARNQGFYRILYEAEVFAPRAHAEHIRSLIDGYRRSLGRAVERGEMKEYSPEELETVVLMLLGVRSYVAMRYIVGGDPSGRGRRKRANAVPEAVVSTYSRLISGGLLRKSG